MKNRCAHIKITFRRAFVIKAKQLKPSTYEAGSKSS